MAYTLVLSMGVAAPAAADADASAATGGTAASEQRSGELGGILPADVADRNLTGSDSTSAADGTLDPAHFGEGRSETESSLWTYVDLASPDSPHHGAEITSVGTGRLVWDRVYTRRALFRFPVESGPGAAVDSAVLRTEVAWSYDCHSDSFLELHRVDPFDGGTTWNDQPTARALLDTQRVRGGRAACPVSGGVEFDVTEAYQWAVDHGEPHIDLRLGERDESGTTAWLRFDVEDNPPVLAVDRSAPRVPAEGSDPTGTPNRSRYGAQGPAPITFAGGHDPSGDTVPAGTDLGGTPPRKRGPGGPGSLRHPSPGPRLQ
ncbi:DNRLRE domain-containing protein [Nocardiopsis metallicus]|uniref:DNRLRE domain-containing protein n=1 Tax=Nocardiopsis metallicus TaxID=179819 RepID=A0A840WDT0_9ACTN|nr:DNRLRE domain-containing protein [Nocardiopsis metallicus]MBB5489897.1 hypothetical protein [Nocardiopsis metallicus]